MVIDCLGLRGVSLQCIAMGTTGVVTPFWSNDNVTFIAAQIMTPGGAAAATIAAAGFWVVPVAARYLRLRLSTATTAGTTTFSVQGSALPLGQPVSQPISGAVTSSGTATVSGTVTATVTAATVTPITPSTFFLNSAATTNGALIAAGNGSVSTLYATNIGAAVAFGKLYNKATAPVVGTDIPEMIIPIPAAVTGVPGVASPQIGFHGHRFPLGFGIAITGAVADTDITAIAAGQVKVKLSRTT